MSRTRIALLSLAAATLFAAGSLHAADDTHGQRPGAHGGEGNVPSTLAPPPGQAPAGAPVQPGDNGFPSPGDEGSADRPTAVAPGPGPGAPGAAER